MDNPNKTDKRGDHEGGNRPDPIKPTPERERGDRPVEDR